jgi:hypothetical protein
MPAEGKPLVSAPWADYPKCRHLEELNEKRSGIQVLGTPLR